MCVCFFYSQLSNYIDYVWNYSVAKNENLFEATSNKKKQEREAKNGEKILSIISQFRKDLEE